jgi:hypothetical protein
MGNSYQGVSDSVVHRLDFDDGDGDRRFASASAGAMEQPIVLYESCAQMLRQREWTSGS